MREFHSITFKAAQSGERYVGKSVREHTSEDTQTEEKVENIGNSYFPALAGSLFAPGEGRGLHPAGIPREGQKI